MTSSQAQPPNTFQEVFAAWDAAQPAHSLLHYYDSLDQKYSFDGSFCYTYEVVLDGWRYIVQAHVHVESGKPHSSGKVFIPGFKGMQAPTPAWVVALAPVYSKQAYPTDWDSNAAYRQQLYDQGYRYPTKL
ncbi:hypothetical protein Cme02nite_51370 [Catellatospora methionotrophica]|uniref:Uncharacterized protein n=1 Tax=Catellatospora methionotrophica TaxID=121620 RepID=A0A8J3LE67_9ACTN|nr:hypothetical protein [Catellatospora methionotrophica]GIG16805.1 hypothetical protein Cme02nite_51370 [Catellatospora methionotrophica]